MNKRSELIKSLKRREAQPKRMKKTGPTIFFTDDAKENTSLIKMREPRRKNKKSRGFFVKVVKKNQIIMFVSALCLVGVGYLTYNPLAETNFVSTTLDNSALADIGDATFVSSQSIVDRIEEAKANNELGVNINSQEAGDAGENNGITGHNNGGENNGITGHNNGGENDAGESSEAGNNSVNNGVSDDSVNNSVEENTVDTSSIATDQSDYFINSKIDRDKMYSQMLEIYQNMLDNQNISSEQKAIATQEITKINNQKNGIMIAENLIKTKGMEDVVIFVNLDSISVVVKADVLQPEQIAQIQNIVTRELEVEISNIHISTR